MATTRSLMVPAGNLDANQLMLTNGVLNSNNKNAGTHGKQKGLSEQPNTNNAANPWSKNPTPKSFK